MSKRELIVLGTSSQVPTRYRNHNGYLLRWDGEGALFDPGEGTQRQMLFADVAMREVTRVCITHFHGDHCLGLPGVVQRLSLDNAPHAVSVHFPGSGQEFYDRLRHASIFFDAAEIVPRPIERDGEVESGPPLRIVAKKLAHPVDTYGYRMDEPDGWRVDPARAEACGVRGPDIGKLVRSGSLRVGDRDVGIGEIADPRPGQSVAFVMDTSLCDAAFELAQGVDLLIIEATYLSSESELARQNGHLTAAQAATIARDAGARRLVLTHFSQRYEEHDEPFRREAEAVFDDVAVAADGIRVPVPARGEVRRP